MNNQTIEREKVLLVGVDTGNGDHFDRSMEELEQLAQACEMEPVGIITQKLDHKGGPTYVGSGKIEEVKTYAGTCEADIVIVNDDLSPSQIRNLSDSLDLPVTDRTGLILDIFSRRAKTAEAKLQVETASLTYLLPRLVGMRKYLGRQRGTSGAMSNRGAGETKLELDRRKIQHRISTLRKELEELEGNRVLQRKKRMESLIPQVALVGYTNAGKSTIMNRMLSLCQEKEEKLVYEEDMLFATLDTSVRRIDTGDRKPFLLTDTVGFIHNLPHGLIQAFRSTLEEVKYADLLVQVIDFSDAESARAMEVTAKTLKELGAADIPMLYVYNKCDKVATKEESEETEHSNILVFRKFPKDGERTLYLSATSQGGDEDGIKRLLWKIKELLYAKQVIATFLIPYDKGSEVSYLRENTSVLSSEYLEEGVLLCVSANTEMLARLSEYAVKEGDSLESIDP
ncbi:MAG: GTPase HflX [Lachnospiraceae bacterium]|jgi:GTP-binding protein HflX|nr:GTPase HflX [Lachnospiraceae bacterium]